MMLQGSRAGVTRMLQAGLAPTEEGQQAMRAMKGEREGEEINRGEEERDEPCQVNTRPYLEAGGSDC